MSTTNVQPGDLNYHHYEAVVYDDEITRVIPGHHELHITITQIAKKHFSISREIELLDLGVGTGITSDALAQEVPNLKITAVDFSLHMLQAAQQRLGPSATYVNADYAELELPPCSFDLIASVISFHHQSHAGKQLMSRKLFKWLRPGGLLLLGDLIAFRDPAQNALAEAMHYAHMRDHASCPEKLAGWMYHHKKLNNLAAIEDMLDWLTESGFMVSVSFVKFQTALLVGRKQ